MLIKKEIALHLKNEFDQPQIWHGGNGKLKPQEQGLALVKVFHILVNLGFWIFTNLWNMIFKDLPLSSCLVT